MVIRAATFLALFLALGCGVPAPPDLPALAARAGTGDGDAVEVLVDLLGSGQPGELRTAAYQALVAAGPRVARPVLEACEDSDTLRREAALALAGNLKLPGAYEKASAALADSTFRRRYVAAWALGELQDARGVEPLLRALSAEEGETAKEAARSLVKLGAAAAPAVRSALPGLQGDARGYGLRILGEIRDPLALEALQAALSEPAHRAEAAWALGTLGRREAAGALRPLVNDPEWRVRLEACRSLGLLEARAAGADLERLRKSDPVPAVREWAARSLALLRGQPQTFPNALGEEVEPENLYR